MISPIAYLKRHPRLSVLGLFFLLVVIATTQPLPTIAQAVGSVVSFEAENGAVNTPSTIINDTQASSGRAVNIGSITNTACNGVQISPGQNIQAAIDANPEDTTFCFQQGTYRLEDPLDPKNDQSFIAAYGAVLNGAKVITGFTQSGSNWIATGFLPSSPSTHGQCITDGCTYAQDIFFDGEPLTRVTDLADLAPGKFYEDFAANEIYLRDNPTDHVVEQAYASAIVDSSATGITIKGFIIEKAATISQLAAIQTRSNPANWIIEHNEIRYNHAGGVYANNGSIVRNNYIHHQGQTGIYGDYGAILIEDNEVSYDIPFVNEFAKR